MDRTHWSWPEPRLAPELQPRGEAVMVTVSYTVPPESERQFVEGMEQMRRARLTTGAVQWGLFRDAEAPQHHVVERDGQAAEHALCGELAKALLVKGMVLREIGQAGAAVEVFLLLVKQYEDYDPVRSPRGCEEDRAGFALDLTWGPRGT